MNPYLFVYNPRSGTRKETRLEERIAHFMGDRPFVFCEIDELERQIPGQPWQAVIAIGGDGTVNSVGRLCKQYGLTLGIIPRGSGDGLARHIGMPHPLDKAMDVILKGMTLTIDTATAGGHFFLNVAGTGFEAHVAHRFAEGRKRGLMSYVQRIRNEFRSYAGEQAQIQENGRIVNFPFFSLSLANGSQWGNDFKIASAADLSDGQLQLVLLSRPKWHQITSLIRYLRSNKQEDRYWVKHRQVKDLEIRSSSALWHIDGEPVTLTDPVEIRIAPSSLQLIVPHG